MSLLYLLVVLYIDMNAMFQELNKRIEEIATSEEQTKQINRELSAQMAQMVREFDDDKQQALDRSGELLITSLYLWLSLAAMNTFRVCIDYVIDYHRLSE